MNFKPLINCTSFPLHTKIINFHNIIKNQTYQIQIYHFTKTQFQNLANSSITSKNHYLEKHKKIIVVCRGRKHIPSPHKFILTQDMNLNTNPFKKKKSCQVAIIIQNSIIPS